MVCMNIYSNLCNNIHSLETPQESLADFIIEYQGQPELLELGTDGVSYDIVDGRYAVLYFPASQLGPVDFTRDSYGAIPKCLSPMDMESLNSSGIVRLQNYPSLNLTGRGTLIAFLDSGIDYQHPVFRNPDGSTRIARLWDQTLSSAPAPEGFSYGREFTAEEIDRALSSEDPLSQVPSQDADGHGTFLAGVAAGSPYPQENFLGAAPGSSLLVVKLRQAKDYLRQLFLIPPDIPAYQENDVMLAVKYVLSCARKLGGLPLTICIALGCSVGSHTGASPLSQYLDSTARVSRTTICLAGGNEGNLRHHYHGTLTAARPSNTAQLQVGENEPGFTLTFWGGSLSPYTVILQSPAGESYTILPSRFTPTQEVRFTFSQAVISISSIPMERQSGSQLILFRFQAPESGIWQFTVSGSILYDSFYHMWLPVRGLVQADTYFLRSSPYETLVCPANAQAPITLTACDYRDQSLYLDASRGYTALGMVKPDLAAPGVDILGPLPGGRFGVRSGTSVACAHTAGAAALFFEWAITNGNDPFLNGRSVKNYLLRGARRDSSKPWPNQDWGYGILDMYNVFRGIF